MIEIKNLSFSYKKTSVFTNIDLAFKGKLDGDD